MDLSSPPHEDDAEGVLFRSTTAFKLLGLAALITRDSKLSAATMGMRMHEGHILGAVAHRSPVTLREVCEETGLDKSKASRLVAHMVESGWLVRLEDPDDQRSFRLLLTPLGRRLHAEVNALGVQRNGRWLSVLTPAQRLLFTDMLTALYEQAEALVEEFSTADGPRQARDSAAPKGSPKNSPTGSPRSSPKSRPVVLVSTERLLALKQQLEELLEGQGRASE